MRDVIRIGAHLAIPVEELSYTVSRSSGPGGQHVNKVSTRVTLHFDVDESPTLTDAQKRRIHERLPTRITRDGRLRVVCQRHRSQAANREEAVERFADLLARALRPTTPRRATKVPGSQKRKRADNKRRRSEIKRGRGRVRRDET